MRVTALVFLLFLIYQCNDSTYLPKPNARLNLQYPRATYEQTKTQCAFAFSMNENARFSMLKDCESKIEYPNMGATVYLSYRPIKNNLDSLLADAYQMPSKHIIKASEIPEKVFVHPEHRAYGTLFRIVGEAASQVQFFLTDSTTHFLVGSLYFYTRPNYDSLMPAALYIEQDIEKLMESLQWASP